MVTVQISPDLKIVSNKLSSLATDLLQEIMLPAAFDAAATIEEAIKTEVPVRTGEGQDSIHANVEPGGAGRSQRIVITGAGYLIYVLKGVDPHPIDPTTGKYLSWLGDSGEPVFTTHVDHPGQAADPFVDRAWAEAQPAISEAIRAQGLRAWRDLANFS